MYDKELTINLPSFFGFYCSNYEETIKEYIYDSDEDEDENRADNVDFKKTYINIARKYFNKWLECSKDKIDDIDLKFTFVELSSPKFYNYSNDKIVVKVEFNEKQILKTLKDLCTNNEDFMQIISENFTSYDGFVSFYPNNPNEWYEKILVDGLDNVHIETLIEYYDLYNEEIEEIEESVLESINEEIE